MRPTVIHAPQPPRSTSGLSQILPRTPEDYTNCFFEQSWWLDAVVPGNWGAALVKKDGRVVARLPYAERRRYGLRLLGNAAFTPTLGPWIYSEGEKLVSRAADEETLLTELITQLPECDLFFQTLPPGTTDTLPFYWQGYDQRMTVTYRLEALDDLDAVWRNFSNKCRNTIRKAQKTLAVRTDCDLHRFLDVANKTFARQGRKSPLSPDIVERIDEACTRRSARRIFCAEDARGRIHGAMYLVWDSRAAYYLIGGADPELRNSGAQHLLMWEAIRFASTVTQVFDFEGSSIQPIQFFIRSFGPRQTILAQVCKMSRRMKALTGMKLAAEAIGGTKFKWFC